MKKNATVKNLLKYDTAFINPGVDEVIKAIQSQKNGQKVLLVFQKQIERNDSFQVTQTFPFYPFEIFKSHRKSRMLKKMFLLCPHLIHPQKVIYLQSGRLKTLPLIIDFFFRNQFKEKSTVNHQKIPENLSFLKIKTLQGIVFQEYKINVSRLFIELLKAFETIGGKVELNKRYNKDEISTIIQCKPEIKTGFLTTIKCPSNFALETKINTSRFRLLENNNLLQITYKNTESQNVTKNQIQQKLEKIIPINSESMTEIELSSFLTTKTISNIIETINTPLPGTFPETKMEDNYELSLEKFDIAKQTGITYPEFKILFHRYGTGIDIMIDKAYEKMNRIRDPKKIWDEVEDWFQQKKEWKVE